MKKWISLLAFAPCLSLGQTGVYAYVPARNGFLPLQSVKVESTVMGEVVRTQSDFVYGNPAPGASEVSFNFELPQTSVLGGFGYFAGDSFVQGMIQVQSAFPGTNNATGLRETGRLDQSSPAVYRCDLSPPAGSGPLRIRVWTVAMVEQDHGKIVVPKPTVEVPIKPGSANWTIRNIDESPSKILGDHYSTGAAQPMAAVTQKFTDGLFYVAGYIHDRHARPPKIEIEHASYEPLSGSRGTDVTAKVADMVRNGRYFVWASDTAFGDPAVNSEKRLRVIAKIDGEEKTLTVSENEAMNLLSQAKSASFPQLHGLREAKIVFQDPQTVAFSGWAVRPRTISASFQDRQYRTCPEVIPSGSDVARLWAQQMLATNSVSEPDRALAFSWKYGILSKVTAFASFTKVEQVGPLMSPGIDVGRGRY